MYLPSTQESIPSPQYLTERYPPSRRRTYRTVPSHPIDTLRGGRVLPEHNKNINRTVPSTQEPIQPKLHYLNDRYPPSIRMATCRTGLLLRVSRLFRSLEIIRPDPIPTPAAEMRMYIACANSPSSPILPPPPPLLLAVPPPPLADSPLSSSPDWTWTPTSRECRM